MPAAVLPFLYGDCKHRGLVTEMNTEYKHKEGESGEEEEEQEEWRVREQLDIYITGRRGPSSCHFKGQCVTQIQRQTNHKFRKCK